MITDENNQVTMYQNEVKTKNRFMPCLAIVLSMGCITCVDSNAQIPSIWNQTSDPSMLNDEAKGIVYDTSGVYVAGFDGIPGDKQLRIEKRSLTTGTLSTSFGLAGAVSIDPTSSDDVANGIAIDASGIYVTGTEMVCLGCDAKWHIEKLTLNTGAMIWSQTSNPSINPDGSNAIAVDPDGVYVAGTVGISFLNWAWRVEKRSLTTGALIWGHTLDVSNLGDSPYSVAVDATGVYVAGFDYTAGNQGWRIEKRDLLTGTVTWAQPSNPSAGDDFATAIAVDATGIYVAGVDVSSGGNNAQWRIEKRNLTTGMLDPAFGNGGVVLSNPGPGYDEARAIALDTSGVYITGFDNIPGNRQWRIEKRDLTTGALLCSTAVNPSANEDIANSIAVDTIGMYAAGTDLITSSTEWRIEKFELCKGTVSVGTPNSDDGISIYPNPANARLFIDHNEIVNGLVDIYDTFGRKVFHGGLTHEKTEISTSVLATGIYTIQVAADGIRLTRKLVVVSD